MKRAIYLLVITLIMSSVGYAQGILNSGTIDGMINWTVYNDGRLTLEGSGSIADYSSSSSVPWYSNRTAITSIELSGSISSIGKYAFYTCTNVTQVTSNIVTPPTLSANTFNSSKLSSITLFVPSMYITDYQTAEYWSQMQVQSSDGGVVGDSNAYLSAIYVDGTMIDGFEPYTFAYHVELPAGTVTAPEVTYLLQDESCMVNAQQADSPNGTATITVMTSDGSMTNSYQITFTVKDDTGGNPGGDTGDETIIDSGMLPTSGTSWTLYSTGKLRFTGGGTMDSYNDPTEVPWYNNRLLVTELNFGADYYSLGDYLFYELDNLAIINCYSSYVPTPQANTFNPNNLANIKAYVRGTLIEQFQNDEYWGRMQLVVIPGTEPEEEIGGLVEGDINWSFSRNSGLLVIYGSGMMPDWVQSMAPWSEYSSEITSAEIGDGITYCCNGAFASCENLQEVTLASTVDSIGEYILPSGRSQIRIYVQSMTPPGITTNTFAGIEGCAYVYCYESAVEAYQNHPIWSTTCLGYMDDPQTGTDGFITIALDTNWHFIMLPQFGGINYEDISTDQEVEWAIYDGAQRAGGQSGWRMVDFVTTYYKDLAHIVRAKSGDAILSINLKGNKNYQNVNISVLHHESSHAENANWNFIGNPYNAGYDINGLLAAGIESPITVWNGTGYSTYTPGMDEYKLQPFEPFFIQLPDEQNSGSIQLSPEYIDETMSLPLTGGSSSGDDGNTGGTDDIVDSYGALPGYFSVSEGVQVQFSRGNLQYYPAGYKWLFAEHQYDTIGYVNANISSTYEGWIDLFGWGTGTNPTIASMVSSDYSEFYDWGNNVIENGGGIEGIWRTLSSDEWSYVFFTRTNATDLYGAAIVNGVSGVILLPDYWSSVPGDLTFTPGFDTYSQNSYTNSEWSMMEAAGAVFLPVTGMRDGSEVYDTGTDGFYWSSSYANDDDAFDIHFGTDGIMQTGIRRYSGAAVRLVKSADSGNGSDPTGGYEGSYTYTFLTKAWDANEGSWVSGMNGYGFTEGRGVQCTTATTGANAQCPITYSNISSVVVTYCTNSNTAGSGTIMIEIGGFNQTQEITSSGGTTLREMVFDFVDSMPSGSPSIMVNCTANSIYIYSVTIITK